MRDRLIDPQPQAFGDAAKLLVRAARQDDQRPLWELLAHAHEDDTLRDEPAVHMVQADLCHRLGLATEEEAALRRVIAFFGCHQEVNPRRARMAYARLRELCSPDGPRANPELWQDCQLRLARLGTDVPSAATEYAAVAGGWSWGEVLAELECCGSDRQDSGPTQLGLLSAWGRAEKTRAPKRIAQAVGYLAAEGWPLVERATEQDARALIASFGARPFMEQPRLAARFAELVLEAQPLDDWKAQAALPLCLAALAAGERVAPHAVAAVNDAIHRGGKYSAFVKELLRPYSDDQDRMGLILLSVSADARPMRGEQIERWLDVFPVEMLLMAPPEVTLALLRRAEPSGLSDAALGALRQLTATLAADGKHGPEAHRLWLAICRPHPARLAEYVRECLAAPMPRAHRAEEAFDRLLEADGPPTITGLLASLGNHPGLAETPRLRQAATFCQIMGERVRPLLGPLGASARREDLLALRRAFAPWTGVERADMLVAIVGALRERLNPDWLTPVEFEAEALCDARRLDEALALERQHPGLKVGPQRQTLGARIEYLRQLNVVREDDGYTEDYRRILRACFMDRARR